ncbi:hypothetical protein FOZ62_029897 [Perkinsus olseni]|uniref:Uncharacterized protein n=1 Tax=Perkinsus olseni TaxID=32597 RepID=A0A7J6RPR6_PEROL|nr:hypothetical protein FOZ62_029897 [Perkinsus olseni]
MVDRSFQMTDDATLREELERYSSRFSIDLNPRILYCKSKMVDLLLESGCAAYLEFQKLKDTLMIWTAPEGGESSSDGESAKSQLRVSDTLTVPVTRQQIFKHKGLSLLEKRQLMKFLTTSANLPPTLAFQSAAAVGTDTYNSIEEEQDSKILLDQAAELDLSTLPSRLLDGFKYAVCLDVDEGDWSNNKSVELQRRLIQFVESLQVYDSDGCAFLLPTYGTGDIVQAFARRCAVESGVHVLRCAPRGVSSTSQGSVEVTTEGGQVISCQHAVISADYVPSQQSNHTISWRAVFCTDKPLLPGENQQLPYRLAVMSLPSRSADVASPSLVSVLQTVVSRGVDKQGWWLTYFSEEGQGASLATVQAATGALLADTTATVLFKLFYHCVGTGRPEGVEEICPNVLRVTQPSDFSVLASDDYTEGVVPKKLFGKILGEDEVKLFDKNIGSED